MLHGTLESFFLAQPFALWVALCKSLHYLSVPQLFFNLQNGKVMPHFSEELGTHTYRWCTLNESLRFIVTTYYSTNLQIIVQVREGVSIIDALYSGSLQKKKY